LILSSSIPFGRIEKERPERIVDSRLVDNMKQRLIRLRRVAAIAHDKNVIDLVTQTADEIEADLRNLEGRAYSIPEDHSGRQ
jgi:hypothetical protein